MIPEPGQTDLSFTGFIILLGVVQGILLTITGLAGSSITSKIKGVLFLVITCIMTEFFLNRTGFMYRVIGLVDFSEPLQFTIPPLIYLGVKSYSTGKLPKRWLMHFLLFFAYALYFIPFYLAPAQYKFDSYYYIHHPGNLQFPPEYHFYFVWGWFRSFQMQLFYLQTTIYLIFTFQQLDRLRSDKAIISDERSYFVYWWFIFSVLISLLIIVVIAVKILFIRDLGDHIIAFFMTFIIYLSTIAEMIKPSSAKTGRSVSSDKREPFSNAASGLSESRMTEIYRKLMLLMENDHLYRDNLVSLQRLAKLAGEPPYVVSKVINEKSGNTFFDWIAGMRVEDARKILADPINDKLTIDLVAEKVGYNSKSAFNKAFKKFTGMTPGEFKNKR